MSSVSLAKVGLSSPIFKANSPFNQLMHLCVLAPGVSWGYVQDVDLKSVGSLPDLKDGMEVVLLRLSHGCFADF